jgi:hypothetical protein
VCMKHVCTYVWEWVCVWVRERERERERETVTLLTHYWVIFQTQTQHTGEVLW